MKAAIKNTFLLISRRLDITLLILVTGTIVSGLLSNFITSIGAFFLIIFFYCAFVGIKVNLKDRIGVTIKDFLVEGSKSYSKTMLTLLEAIIIFVVDYLVVFFFSVMPIIIIYFFNKNLVSNAQSSKTTFLMIFILVLIYRMPLFIYSFFSFHVFKESGRYAIIKIKEIIWNNPILYFVGFIQLLIIFIFSLFLQPDTIDSIEIGLYLKKEKDNIELKIKEISSNVGIRDNKVKNKDIILNDKNKTKQEIKIYTYKNNSYVTKTKFKLYSGENFSVSIDKQEGFEYKMKLNGFDYKEGDKFFQSGENIISCYIFKPKNLYVYMLLDILKYFIVTVLLYFNYFLLKEIISKNKKLKEKYDNENYNSRFYKLIGRFLM